MRLVFSGHAWEDYLYWQSTDRRIVRRINALIENIRRSPLQGDREAGTTQEPTGRLLVSPHRR